MIIPQVAYDYVSVVWEGFLTVPQSNNYIFSMFVNDGVKLTLD